jgi:hypothetical protein
VAPRALSISSQTDDKVKAQKKGTLEVTDDNDRSYSNSLKKEQVIYAYIYIDYICMLIYIRIFMFTYS